MDINKLNVVSQFGACLVKIGKMSRDRKTML